MRVGDEDQPVRDDRRRHRDVAAAGHAPQLLAGREVVAADVLPAVDDDLRAAAFDVHDAGVLQVGTSLRGVRHSSLPVAELERGDERALLHVGLHDHAVRRE